MVKCIDEIMEPTCVEVSALRTAGMLDHRKLAIFWEQRVEHNHAPCGTVGLLEFRTRIRAELIDAWLIFAPLDRRHQPLIQSRSEMQLCSLDLQSPFNGQADAEQRHRRQYP